MECINDLQNGIQNLDSALLHLRQRLDTLDKERGDLLLSIDIISNQRRELVKRLDQIQGRNPSLPLTFPTEVFRLIFLQCIPEKGNAPMNPNEPPLLLGQVCRLWRDISFSTPELWDTIHIGIPGIDYDPLLFENQKWKEYLSSIERWLSRSAPRPLSISVTDENVVEWFGIQDQREGLFDSVLGVLMTESTRWKNVRMELELENIIKYSEIHLSQLPIMETLQLCSYRLDSEPTISNPRRSRSLPDHDISPMVLSPQLRSLHLHDVQFFPNLERQEFYNQRWDSLRDLSLGDKDLTLTDASCLSGSEVLTIFMHLINTGAQLQSCTMTIDHTERITTNTQISMQSLQNFSVLFYDSETNTYYAHGRNPEDLCLLPFFERLNFPSLRGFEYKSIQRSSFPFLPFLQRSEGIKRLGLYLQYYRDDYSYTDLEKCSVVLSRITELHLSSSFSKALINSDTLNLSSLETLKLDCTPPMSTLDVYECFVRNTEEITNVNSRWDPELRRVVERKRYADLKDRIELLEHLKGSRKDKGLMSPGLRIVSFRLNERLRKIALHLLQPLIEGGLRVVFEKDYYNFSSLTLNIPIQRQPFCSSNDPY